MSSAESRQVGMFCGIHGGPSLHLYNTRSRHPVDNQTILRVKYNPNSSSLCLRCAGHAMLSPPLARFAVPTVRQVVLSVTKHWSRARDPTGTFTTWLHPCTGFAFPARPGRPCIDITIQEGITAMPPQGPAMLYYDESEALGAVSHNAGDTDPQHWRTDTSRKRPRSVDERSFPS